MKFKNLIHQKRSVIAYFAVVMAPFNVNASLILDTNLISNPGFESGLTDWQSTNATIRTSSDPTAYDGSNYIFGQSTASFTISQTIDLLGSGFLTTEIDTNNLNINFGGWQSGWNSFDEGQIAITLLGTGGTGDVLYTTALSSFTSTRDNAGGTGWQLQSGITDLLSGTRYINYEFTGTRGPDFPDSPEYPATNSNNDAYLDNAYIEITAVPVPAALWLFGSGLIGLVGIARRRKS